MIATYLKNSRDEIDRVLEEYVRELKYPTVIAEGMEYALLNGGKRIRPILLSLTLELLGIDRSLGFATGAAIEFIHSYSLVHDDLPALDNDDYRRGKLTTHKKYGEAEGILIGDALLTHAFGILVDKNSHLEPSKVLEIISLTSLYAGINGMIGGQMVDIESEGEKIPFDKLKYIHANKTGKLISLPIECGAIIAKVSKEERDELKRFSELLGLAFQIRDDILDVEGEFEKLGKSIGSDIALDKSTYPSIFGMEKSKEILKEITHEAKEIIRKRYSGDSATRFIELVDYIANRES